MDPQIEKAQRQLELLSSDDDVRRLAEALEDAQREWVSSIEDSREEGEARGKAAGMTLGRQEGIKEMALKLLAKGMDVRFVSEVSGMSLQQVRELAASLKSR